MNERAAKAHDIFRSIIYMTVATADKSGQPWNTPVADSYDEELNFYWFSSKKSQHSLNIAANPKIFVVKYDSKAPEGTGEGIYMLGRAHELKTEADIVKAMDASLKSRGFEVKDKPEEYMGDSPRRFYKFVPERMWINDEGEDDGHYVDVRHEIDLGAL